MCASRGAIDRETDTYLDRFDAEEAYRAPPPAIRRRVPLVTSILVAAGGEVVLS
jgi:hypothetical protein